MATYVRHVLRNPCEDAPDVLLRPATDLAKVPADSDLSIQKAAALLGITPGDLRDLMGAGYLRERKNPDTGKFSLRGKDLQRFVAKETDKVDVIAEEDDEEDEKPKGKKAKAGEDADDIEGLEGEDDEDEKVLIVPMSMAARLIRKILRFSKEEDETGIDSKEQVPTSKSR